MSEEQKKDGGDLVQLGALWKNEGKDGTQYLSGTFGAANVFVFKNKWKKGEKDPDYRIFVGARRRKPKEEEAKTEEAAKEEAGTDIQF